MDIYWRIAPANGLSISNNHPLTPQSPVLQRLSSHVADNWKGSTVDRRKCVDIELSDWLCTIVIQFLKTALSNKKSVGYNNSFLSVHKLYLRVFFRITLLVLDQSCDYLVSVEWPWRIWVKLTDSNPITKRNYRNHGNRSFSHEIRCRISTQKQLGIEHGIMDCMSVCNTTLCYSLIAN